MTQSAVNDDLIYVVDDDHSVSKLVAFNLTARGYQVKQFDNGNAVLDRLASEGPSLIILDVLPPGTNGLEVTRRVRQISPVPIMILSVHDETSAKLAALDMGADDYITKPFRVEELLARVRAILRRSARSSMGSSGTEFHYRCGGLSIDLESLEVSSHRKAVHLTQQEWSVLKVLVKHAGRVVSRRQILQEAWGDDYGDEADYVRTYIIRLRKKLEPEPRKPRYILLERGLGYRLVKGK